MCKSVKVNIVGNKCSDKTEKQVREKFKTDTKFNK